MERRIGFIEEEARRPALQHTLGTCATECNPTLRLGSTHTLREEDKEEDEEELDDDDEEEDDEEPDNDDEDNEDDDEEKNPKIFGNKRANDIDGEEGQSKKKKK